MKSRFTYGMFAGFALACLFFFFFLFFFPNVFRTLTAKKSPNQTSVAVAPVAAYYDGEYVAYKPPVSPAYYGNEYVAYKPPTGAAAPARQPNQTAGGNPNAYRLPLSAGPVTRPGRVIPGAPEAIYGRINPNPVAYYYDPQDTQYGRSMEPPASV